MHSSRGQTNSKTLPYIVLIYISYSMAIKICCCIILHVLEN